MYILLANKLYNSSVILLNLNSNSTTSDFTNAINLDTFIGGISKIHLLFFSYSGGLLWTAPVVLVGIVALIANNKSNLNFYQK